MRFPCFLHLSGWNRINDGLFAISARARNYDSALAPSRVLLRLTTTLVKVNGVWRVAEYSQLNDLECGIILDGISEVLTLAHDEVNSFEALGFREVDDRTPAVAGAFSSSSNTRQPGQESQAYNLLSHQMQLWLTRRTMLHPNMVMLLQMFLLLQERQKSLLRIIQRLVMPSAWLLMALH